MYTAAIITTTTSIKITITTGIVIATIKIALSVLAEEVGVGGVEDGVKDEVEEDVSGTATEVEAREKEE